MTHAVAELNQVKITILRRLAAEPPTRRWAARWDLETGGDGLTRQTPVDSLDHEFPNRVDPEVQK